MSYSSLLCKISADFTAKIHMNHEPEKDVFYNDAKMLFTC